MQPEHLVPPAPADEARPTRARRRWRSAQDVRERRRRLASYVLLAFSLVLVVNALVGENGYLATFGADREYQAVREELTRIRIENQEMKERIQRLSTDPTAIEEAARRDLGLIKPGETLVIVRDVPSVAAAGSR